MEFIVTIIQRMATATATAAAVLALATPAAMASSPDVGVSGTHRVDGYVSYGACENGRIAYLHAGYKVSLRCYPGHAWYFEWYTF